jgi:hypothetical protein
MRPAKVLKEAFSAAGFAVGKLDIVLVYKKSSQAARWAERYHAYWKSNLAEARADEGS